MTMISSTLAIARSRCHRGFRSNPTARVLSARLHHSLSHAPRRNTAPSPAACVCVRRYAAHDDAAAAAPAFGPHNMMAGPSPASFAAAAAGSGRAGDGGGGLAGRVFFTSLCLGTFGLGAWQTRRYFEKVDMVQKREEDLGREPLAGFREWQALKTNAEEETADQPGRKRYRRVRLRGMFRHDRAVLIGPRGPPPGALADTGPNSGRGGGGGMSSSIQGYYVIAPLVVAEEDAAVPPPAAGEDRAGEEAPARRGWGGTLWGRGRGRAPPFEAPGATAPPPASDARADREVVWINRGWIPRTHVDRHDAVATPWSQPEGLVELTAMESSTETPGAYSPPSRLDPARPRGGTDARPTVHKLLWMEREAMAEIMDAPPSAARAPDAREPAPPLFVEIAARAAPPGPPAYPVRPAREAVGEFKVASGVHAGYAATWFGLSGAGVAMTRTLLRRGR